VLDFVPFVGSIYTFGEGVMARDPKQALNGAFHFGLDLLFGWLGGVGERFAERRIAGTVSNLVSEIGMAQHEPRALAMLSALSDEIGDVEGGPRPGVVPLARTTIRADPFGVLLKDAEVPVAHRAAAAAAREGREVTVSLTRSPAPAFPDERRGDAGVLPEAEQYTLRHSATRDAVMPVRSEDGHLNEFDWEGRVLRALPDLERPAGSVLGDTALQEPEQEQAPGSHSQPPAGNAETADRALHATPAGFHAAVYPGAFEAGFLRRSTVSDFERFVASITHDGPDRAMPKVVDFVRVIDTGAASQVRAAHDVVGELQTICNRSRTFQLLLRHAVRSMENSQSRFELQVMRHASAICDLERCVIRLPPSRELPQVSYFDARGSTPFQGARAWVHELVHAMTHLKDPPIEERRTSRGAVVYLTDRILYESGCEVPERLTYDGVTLTGAPNSGNGLEPLDVTRRGRLAASMLTEDAYLDARLEPFLRGGEDPILNVPAGARLTIRQVKALRAEMRNEEARAPVARLPFQERFCNLWDVAMGQDFALSMEWSGRFRDDAGDFYRHNALFRHLAERWYESAQGARWQLWLSDRQRPDTPFPSGWAIDRDARRVTLYRNGDLYYLSEAGPRAMEFSRRIMGLLADLVAPGDTDFSRPREALLNRGLRVYLENLGLARFRHLPRRVSGSLATTPEALLPWAIKARRAMNAEDAWLDAGNEEGTAEASESVKAEADSTDPDAPAPSRDDALTLDNAASDADAPVSAPRKAPRDK
jgi:hypothetical protein